MILIIDNKSFLMKRNYTDIRGRQYGRNVLHVFKEQEEEMCILNDSKHAKCNDNTFQEDQVEWSQQEEDVFNNKSHIMVCVSYRRRHRNSSRDHVGSFVLLTTAEDCLTIKLSISINNLDGNYNWFCQSEG